MNRNWPQDVTLDGFHVMAWPTGYQTVTCLTCKREASAGSPQPYGTVFFRPLDHDPHCPARNHVYLEGIGPMIEPRAMVFEKTEGE